VTNAWTTWCGLCGGKSWGRMQLFQRRRPWSRKLLSC